MVGAGIEPIGSPFPFQVTTKGNVSRAGADTKVCIVRAWDRFPVVDKVRQCQVCIVSTGTHT
jgi:hypothetical protein